MFGQILFTQWKSLRIGLIPFTLAAFGLPLLIVQGFGGDHATAASVRVDLQLLASESSVLAGLFPVLAAGLGFTAALNAWNWDHKGEHLYALSVPIERWRYSLYKMGAGVLLLLVPTSALWVGSLLATASLTLPAGLNAYPTLLTIRFFVASLLMFSMMFALASGTVRTTVILFSVLVGGIFGVGMFGETIVNAIPGIEFQIDTVLKRVFIEWPGPFQVFSGNWTLIDV